MGGEENKEFRYKEVTRDGAETALRLRSMVGDYNLIVVEDGIIWTVLKLPVLWNGWRYERRGSLGTCPLHQISTAKLPSWWCSNNSNGFAREATLQPFLLLFE
ncbi:hypothetical protein Nepgr_000053 [Nepenthes gracilis]|uniref:Uncharacterized protein n=1 Tax=Nepenthes gracilis TaxID=150966 RepID=A0AAD3P2I1_NEPGR|nr:hypothetical protein Nepgr_000053 [Nepenthes gracilis]